MAGCCCCSFGSMIDGAAQRRGGRRDLLHGSMRLQLLTGHCSLARWHGHLLIPPPPTIKGTTATTAAQEREDVTPVDETIPDDLMPLRKKGRICRIYSVFGSALHGPCMPRNPPKCPHLSSSRLSSSATSPVARLPPGLTDIHKHNHQVQHTNTQRQIGPRTLSPGPMRCKRGPVSWFAPLGPPSTGVLGRYVEKHALPCGCSFGTMCPQGQRAEPFHLHRTSWNIRITI